jgi:hypothetical protein
MALLSRGKAVTLFGMVDIGILIQNSAVFAVILYCCWDLLATLMTANIPNSKTTRFNVFSMRILVLFVSVLLGFITDFCSYDFFFKKKLGIIFTLADKPRIANSFFVHTDFFICRSIPGM